MTRGRLAGRCVLVTRRREDAASWVRRLEQEGARAVVLPCLEIVPVDDPSLGRQLAEALGGGGGPCWLALTSPRGAEAVRRLLHRVGRPLPDRVLLAAIGEATAARIERTLGRPATLVAPGGTGASLAAALATRLAGEERARVVVAASDRASRDLEEALVPRGVEVVRLAVYRTIPAPRREPRLDLAALGVDTVLLASPSAVEGLLAQAVVPPGVLVVAIGPVTARAVRAAGLPLAGVAERRDIEGLLAAIPPFGESDGGGQDA